MPYFDNFGWYSSTEIPDRFTATELPSETLAADHAWMWTGYAWIQYSTLPLPSPVIEAPVRHITQLAFMTRFTDAEAIALDLASIGATVEAASMRRYLDKVKVAKHIDLDRADTRAGVQMLETIGLLAAGRALQILDAPIEPSERA